MDDGMRQSDRRLEVSMTEARQGTQEGVVRYVLGISLALVIIAFAVIYYLYA
jgi:hypothetical protein